METRKLPSLIAGQDAAVANKQREDERGGKEGKGRGSIRSRREGGDLLGPSGDSLLTPEHFL